MSAVLEPRRGARAHLRTLRTAFWLGWKIESNWTDPFVFVVYSIVRPLAGAMILVFMYYAAGRVSTSHMMDFLIVGTAFWPFVLAGVRGMVHGHIEDREQYQTVRAVYTSPISYRVFLVGRALAQVLAVAAVASIVTLIIGRVALHVSYDISLETVALALTAVVLGVIGVLSIGVVSVGASMLTSGEGWQMPEGIAAGLYLLSGAIYPVTILPTALEWVAKVLPLSWWLEATRRALSPAAPRSFPWASDGRVFVTLILLTAGFAVFASVLFAVAERRARTIGAFDERSGY